MDYEKNESSVWIDDDFNELVQSREWMEVPERRLLFAILERAVRDALGNNREEAEAARDWIYTGGDGEPESFTFRWICSVLEVDQGKFLGNVSRLITQKSLELMSSIPEAGEHAEEARPRIAVLAG